MNGRLVFLALATVTLWSLIARAQKAGDPVPKKKPELKLRIAVEKETYSLNEKLFAKIEFTNLTNTTLCFPEPEQGFEDPVVGDLTLVGTGPKGDRNYFVEHFDGVMPGDEKLLANMQQTWIQLGPNQIYVTKRAPTRFELDTPGEWKLRAEYIPPLAPFNPEGSRERLRTLAEKVGCTPPEVDATSAIERISVVAAPSVITQ